MKIYTKTGDLGETSTYSGKRVNKTNIRIRVNGEIDELNSTIGIVVSHLDYGQIKESLIRVQNELFDLGTDVSLGNVHSVENIFRITEENTKNLEQELDDWEKGLPELKAFILPSGSVSGAFAHQARSVCRRAERELVALSHIEKVNPDGLKYLNRLSDWLFVLARKLNKLNNSPEIKFESSIKKKK